MKFLEKLARSFFVRPLRESNRTAIASRQRRLFIEQFEDRRLLTVYSLTPEISANLYEQYPNRALDYIDFARSGSSYWQNPVTIFYHFEGTATPGKDYTLPRQGIAVIPALQSYTTIPIHPIDDPWRESPDETILLY